MRVQQFINTYFKAPRKIELTKSLVSIAKVNVLESGMKTAILGLLHEHEKEDFLANYKKEEEREAKETHEASKDFEIPKWITDLVDNIQEAYLERFPEAILPEDNTGFKQVMASIDADMKLEQLAKTSAQIYAQLEASLQSLTGGQNKRNKKGSSQHFSILCWTKFYNELKSNTTKHEFTIKFRPNPKGKTTPNNPKIGIKPSYLLFNLFQHNETGLFKYGIDKIDIAKAYAGLTGNSPNTYQNYKGGFTKEECQEVLDFIEKLKERVMQEKKKSPYGKKSKKDKKDKKANN